MLSKLLIEHTKRRTKLKDDRNLSIVTTNAAVALYKKAAKKAGLSMAEWIRQRLQFAISNELVEIEIVEEELDCQNFRG